MRSSAGIVAGLFLVALVANCGSDDTGSSSPTGGSTGEGGDGGTTKGGSAGSTSKGGSSGSANANGGAGGVIDPSGCTTADDCAANEQCIDDVCKKDDGQACTGADECVNTCIDGSCTALLDDGEDCTADEDCAHTCIDGVCAPKSAVGGDCDVELPPEGEGGAGGQGTGGQGAGGLSSGGQGAGGLSAGGVPSGSGGEAGAPALPPSKDCEAPLQCFAGKCLTPDGEACTDNVDCLNTCVENVCTTKGTIDGACDDASDCAVAALVCDEATATCKLDLLQQCSDNAQCKSERCICSDANCSVRVCKQPGSVCQCKWSPADSVTCNNTSANLNAQTQDPNGCDVTTANICSNGQCVTNAGGDCAQACQTVGNGQDGMAGTMDDICAPNGAATGCNAGYGAVDKSTPPGCHTAKNIQGTYFCTTTCACELN